MFGDNFGGGGGFSGGGYDGGDYTHSYSSFDSFNSFDNYSSSANYDVNADAGPLSSPGIVFDVTAVNAGQGFAEQARVLNEATVQHESAAISEPDCAAPEIQSAPRVGFISRFAGFFGIA